MIYVIDRFEESYVILVDDSQQVHQMQRHELPQDCREGDCLRWDGEAWIIDTEETARRKGELSMRLQNLFTRRRKRIE